MNLPLPLDTLKIVKLNSSGNPIIINNHISVGPFVRITELPNDNYIYIAVFFESSTITSEENIGLKATYEFTNEENSEAVIYLEVTVDKKTNINAEKQSLWSITCSPDMEATGPFTIKRVEVRVDFAPANANEPTRGTVVIPPGGGDSLGGLK
ncbi:hypothetical protein [Tenacibaculum amylolyticum]|uniref:hypothetical protein n=1 Tax=Tenacibaculum amylolyticum TaxID=104269 RepID=UPI003892EDF8